MSRSKRARSSAFGLALLASLAFAAFAAGGAQASTWHIDGQSFSGEESVSWSGGPIKVTRPAWGVTIACGTVTGTTQVKESSKSSGTMTLGSCAVEGNPACTVQPLKLGFTGYLVDSGNQAYERYNVGGKWTITGAGCSLTEQPNVEGSIAAAVGVPDAVNSPRVFSAAAESATGASGLHFIGGYWKASGNAAVSLAGKNSGKDFGVGIGGTWKPSAATWTIGNEAFSGSEEVLWNEDPTWVQIERTTGGLAIECEYAYGVAQISAGDQSEAWVVIEGCSIPAAPKCVVGGGELELSGQIGRDGGYVYEKAEVNGTWAMSGTGCPFTGTKAVSGSIGAYIESGGLSNHAYFSEDATGTVKGTGLRVNGETWVFSAEVLTSLLGANAGKAFGVQ